MQVVLDGAAIGTVHYNQCRGTQGPSPAVGQCDDDVAQLFPAATNITQGSGAIGSFVIDTTALANGLHTIAWGVTDNLGRTEGIGSRFFTVFNPSGTEQAGSAAASAAPAIQTGALATLDAGEMTVAGRVGFDFQAPFEMIRATAAGIRPVRFPELGRLELRIGPRGADGVCHGFCVDGGSLIANGIARALPPGSRLDVTSGTFTWTPGPGYIGSYELAFVRQGESIRIGVTIEPATRPGGAIRANVDRPARAAAASGPLTVAGWALDTGAWHGSGIGAVHVWVIRKDVPGAAPQFLGAAALDGARPDVAAQFGAGFGQSGWHLVAEVPPGAYDVMAYYYSTRTGRFEDRQVVSTTVR
jgi:hypothetical protein